MNPILIGLSGKARHGKDTFFDALVDEFGAGRVRRVGFADGVRHEAKAEGLWDGVVPYTAEGRSALQKYGTDRRATDPLYWVKAAFRFIAETELGLGGRRLGGESVPETLVWVVTDVRFRNEADAIRERGGVVVRIERVNDDGTEFDNGMTAAQRNHVSEVDLDGYAFDFVCENRRLEVYRSEVAFLVHCLLGSGDGRMKDGNEMVPPRTGRMDFDELNSTSTWSNEGGR